LVNRIEGVNAQAKAAAATTAQSSNAQ
jgi:hypothetical protein